MQTDYRLRLTSLHPAQSDVVSHSARYNVLACGRRWGKTLLGIDRLVHPALVGYPVGWFSPTYRMLGDAWRDVREIMEPVIAHVRQDEYRLELITDGVVEMWSLDNPDTARGRRYARVVVDEAAMAQHLQMAWENVIRPTLTDFRGDAWFMSTPAGMNYFWQLWQRGMDGAEEDWQSWQLPTSTNPLLDAREIAAARRQLPEQVFAQEYLAQFIEGSGYVFRRIDQATTSVRVESAEDGHAYSVGLDWGKLADFTVVSIVDIDEGRQVYLDRFNHIDYGFQIARVGAVLDRFPDVYVVAESNAVGEPLIDRMRQESIRVHSYTMTQPSKARLIEDLALAVENGELAILDDVVQTGELLAYTQERLPSGATRYGAPPGLHDDCVMALALAWHGASKVPPDATPGYDRFAALDDAPASSIDLIRTPTGIRFGCREGGNGHSSSRARALKFRGTHA